MIEHLISWNHWRKYCMQSKFYKFLVLITIVDSPTLRFVKESRLLIGVASKKAEKKNKKVQKKLPL